MKKLLLLSALFIFGCGGDEDSECIDFTPEMTKNQVESLIANSKFVKEYLNKEISENGKIICQGWYANQDAYSYIFENGIYFQVTGTCAAFGFGNAKTFDCDEFFGTN